MPPDRLIPLLLTLAWLVPLGGAVAAWAAGRIGMDRSSRLPAWVAVGGAAVSLNLSLGAGFVAWRMLVAAVNQTVAIAVLTGATTFSGSFGLPLAGTYYTLGEFGGLSLSVDYYVDSLTVLMFCVVTLIATCVHVFAVAYMSDGHADDDAEDHPEPTPAEVDPVAALHDAQPSPFKPQFARFFALLQLFTFAMLGLVLAGNLLQVFAFWELVGAISYLLIGFHFERPHAAGAATKAFVMNRIGDAGFLVGMAILWTAFGTVTFDSSYPTPTGKSGGRYLMGGFAPNEWSLGLLGHGDSLNNYYNEIEPEFLGEDVITSYSDGQPRGFPRWVFVVAGLCLFTGCIGKSAQLPLSTWLPDAMAGPTPVSALVHSATMVAAGVYLVARAYPLFLPEVLLVIAYVGAATLVYGATCAVFQSDLKRILAYSTVSQLGYMMLALGVGGREAGLFHLVTHAYFKGLLFLAAGSVIVACHHVQDVTRLGGLRKRMPLTAYTSLVGVIAIAGMALPTEGLFGEAIAFSGYHSKDSILATALAFTRLNPGHGLLFVLPLVTAGLTAFYMFRFWLLAFAGRPRDEELTRHVKESSWLMTVPLVVLALFAAFVAIGGERGPLYGTIEVSGPASPPVRLLGVDRWRHELHEAHGTAAVLGLVAAAIGTALALGVYGAGLMNARKRTAFITPIAGFFRDGWKLDRLYGLVVVRPYELLAFAASLFDRFVLDKSLVGVSRLTVGLARFDRVIDERIVDGFVNRLAEATYAAGRGLRHVQTGRLRQYVMALAAAAVILFALAVVLIPK